MSRQQAEGIQNHEMQMFATSETAKSDKKYNSLKLGDGQACYGSTDEVAVAT
jgi:hypothetical protein